MKSNRILEYNVKFYNHTPIFNCVMGHILVYKMNRVAQSMIFSIGLINKLITRLKLQKAIAIR
jgi:hypothetical protein